MTGPAATSRLPTGHAGRTIGFLMAIALGDWRVDG